MRFRQAKKFFAKKVLEAKLTYANKTKEPITSKKCGSRDFWLIANSVVNKLKISLKTFLKILKP